MEAVHRQAELVAQQQALATLNAARGGVSGEFPDAATFASVYEYYLSQQRALATFEIAQRDANYGAAMEQTKQAVRTLI